MYLVTINYEKCNDCWQCEIWFPGFRYKHGAMMKISKTAPEDEENRELADLARKNCPEKAIQFRVT